MSTVYLRQGGNREIFVRTVFQKLAVQRRVTDKQILIKPNIDQWKPAEHTGTFRGHNLAFVAARVALMYWENENFAKEIKRKEQILLSLLNCLKTEYPQLSMKVRGRGFIYGVEMPKSEIGVCTSLK